MPGSNQAARLIQTGAMRMSSDWMRYDSVKLAENQLVAVWNREIELEAECRVCIVGSDGTLWLADRTGDFCIPTNETTVRHIGWFVRGGSKDSPPVDFRAEGEAAPQQAAAIQSIQINIPPLLGMALAGLVVSLKNGVDKVQTEPGDVVL